MKSRIRKIGDIDASEYANVVVARGRVREVIWSSFPPRFFDSIVEKISGLFFSRMGKEIAVMRSQGLLLEDETGKIVYEGLRGPQDEDAICEGEEVIVCGAVTLKEGRPHLLFLKKKTSPSFLIRLSHMSRESVAKEPERTFFASLKRKFPEIFLAWKDVADLFP